MHLYYGSHDWIVKQILPSTCDDDQLDDQAALWVLDPRVPATFAAGSVTFTGTSGAVIPSGTLLQRSDGAEFATDAEATIASSGSIAVTITASVAGLDGNTAAAIVLTLMSPITTVDSEVAVATGGLIGGSDAETDDTLRARILDRIQNPPMGGCLHDYETWAKDADSTVYRVWPYSCYRGPGTVEVFFVTNDLENAIPSSALRLVVADYIDTQKPVTAIVNVSILSAKTINFEINLPSAAATTAIKAAIVADLKDFFWSSCSPDTTMLLSRIDEVISLASGEEGHVLVSPSAAVVLADNEFPVLGTVTWGTI